MFKTIINKLKRLITQKRKFTLIDLLNKWLTEIQHQLTECEYQILTDTTIELLKKYDYRNPKTLFKSVLKNNRVQYSLFHASDKRKEIENKLEAIKKYTILRILIKYEANQEAYNKSLITTIKAMGYENLIQTCIRLRRISKTTYTRARAIQINKKENYRKAS